MNNIRDQKLINRFGVHVRALRKERGLTMTELSYKTGVEYRQISNIETGKVNCTLSTINALAKALDIPLAQLMDF